MPATVRPPVWIHGSPVYHLLWFYVLTVFDFSCLAMLAKPYPMLGLTLMPQIPNQLHFIQKSAHEVLDANLEARVMPVFT